MTETVTCHKIIGRGPFGYAPECGALVPRLDDGPCAYKFTYSECFLPQEDHMYWGHAYLAPLAAECADGHIQPVEVS